MRVPISIKTLQSNHQQPPSRKTKTMKSRAKRQPPHLSCLKKWMLFLTMTLGFLLQSRHLWPLQRGQSSSLPAVSTRRKVNVDCIYLYTVSDLCEFKSNLVRFVDPAFSTMFDGNFEEILFKTPSVVSGWFLNINVSLLDHIDWMGCSVWFDLVMLTKWEKWVIKSKCLRISQFFSCPSLPAPQLDVGSFLRLLCLAEDMRTDPWDVSSLLRLNGCDIRQSLLQLQFWTRSGGGRHVTKPLTHTGKNGKNMSWRKRMKQLE